MRRWSNFTPSHLVLSYLSNLTENEYFNQNISIVQTRRKFEFSNINVLKAEKKTIKKPRFVK